MTPFLLQRAVIVTSVVAIDGDGAGGHEKWNNLPRHGRGSNPGTRGTRHGSAQRAARRAASDRGIRFDGCAPMSARVQRASSQPGPNDVIVMRSSRHDVRGTHCAPAHPQPASNPRGGRGGWTNQMTHAPNPDMSSGSGAPGSDIAGLWAVQSSSPVHRRVSASRRPRGCPGCPGSPGD